MIEAPILIIGCPRPGTTLLQYCLSVHPEVWHLRAESHAILEGPFHPARSGYESNRVTAEALTEGQSEALRARFYAAAMNLSRVVSDPARLLGAETPVARLFSRLSAAALGRLSRVAKPARIRFVEKTPKNTLRVPMLARLFPDARFLWLRRRAEPNIRSLVAGWRAGPPLGRFWRPRFATYPVAGELRLRDYRGRWWKFALVPGWRDLRGRDVADVATWQYYQCNRFARADLAAIERERVLSVQFEEFIDEPVEYMRQILEWAGLPPSHAVDAFVRRLPRVNQTSSRPARGAAGASHDAEVAAALERLPAVRELERELTAR